MTTNNTPTSEPHNEICTGFRIILGQKSGYEHFFGGLHACVGAECLNCRKPLMLHWTLDLSDLRLNLSSLGLRQLHLFYCMRCELSWDDFSYQILDDSRCRIIEMRLQEVENRVSVGWDENVGGDIFPKIPFSLERLPDRVQELWRLENQGVKLTPADSYEIASLLGRFYVHEDGTVYRNSGPVNQIGGRGLLYQSVPDPPCPACNKNGQLPERMRVIATLLYCEMGNLVVTFDGVQIIWFLCTTCRTIKVIHRI